MLIRRTPGVTWGPGSWELGHLGWPTTWTLPTSPQKDRTRRLFWHCPCLISTAIIIRGLILYCPGIIVPILLSDHGLFFVYFTSALTQDIAKMPMHVVFSHIFYDFWPFFEEWLACPNTSVVECGGALLWQNMTRAGGCVAHTLTLALFCNKPQWKEKCTNTQTYRCSASMCVGGLCQSTNTHRNCFSIGHFLWSSWSALVETSVRSAEPLLTRLPASSSEQLLTRNWWYNTIPDICQERQERRVCKIFGWV